MGTKRFLLTVTCSLFFLYGNWAAALDIQRPWIQGGLIIGKTDPSHHIRFLEREVRLTPDGYFVVGLGRDIGPTVELIETFPSGEKKTYTFDVTQRTYKEQRVEGVPKRTVDVPEESLARIRQENQLTKTARAIATERQDFLTSFIWPAKGVISGVYGSRRVYNGQPRRPHYGVDIAAPKGSPVIAPAPGKVTLVHNDMYFSGGTLIVDHGYGVSSTFIHLHKILVKEGDEIQQGQLIAEIGSSGRATGPHLDWRMNWFDQRLDPQLLFDRPPEKQ